MADFDWKKFFLIAVPVAVVVLLFLWGVPPLLLEQEMGHLDKPDAYRLADLKDAYRRTLAQILGGLALLYGLYLTYRRIVATEDNVRVAEEGQVTERFTRAIEQLGHEEMAIRLGGIYALERLAKDSEKDHGPIMEVLTAYVRENSKHPRGASERPPIDIQAILTVIGRRKTTDMQKFDAILDLSNTYLAGVALYDANLSGVNLSGADLSGAKLHGVNLSTAVLIGVNLSQATLIQVNLSGVNLHEVSLSQAMLTGVNLHGADLSRADLSRAMLSGVNLSRASLGGADLHEAHLRKVEHLTEEQVREAANWGQATLPDYLQSLPTEQPAPPV